MTDLYDHHAPSLTTPPMYAASVTPDDATDLPFVTRAIYVGSAGAVRVLTVEDMDVTYQNLLGTKVLRVKRVFATGTTASDIVAEW